jgi:4'-phosphopantetheinyl transferase
MPRPLAIYCEGPFAWEASASGDAGAFTLRFHRLEALRPRLDAYERMLDPVEAARAARFRFTHDRERFILGHGALREALGEALGANPAALRFARGSYGKPMVEGVPLRFNFSDTKDAVLIGISGAHEIGVDLETMARTVDHDAVSSHYFTPEEDAAIRASGDRKRRFLELWTRKEAVLKASGVGIMDDLRALRVDAPLNAVMIGHEAFEREAAQAYHVRTWRIGEHHIASVAMEAPLPVARLVGG